MVMKRFATVVHSRAFFLWRVPIWVFTLCLAQALCRQVGFTNSGTMSAFLIYAAVEIVATRR
jgi:hypothetical protein